METQRMIRSKIRQGKAQKYAQGHIVRFLLDTSNNKMEFCIFAELHFYPFQKLVLPIYFIVGRHIPMPTRLTRRFMAFPENSNWAVPAAGTDTEAPSPQEKESC